ncbi:unnamed protein product [Knipowitschia caucasica]|uniref:Uncharacterized protein n=1 Tax=Knipowitschia caucasica TaxID=637954 RepID=A0AAV2MAW6_KNICA
MDKPCFKKVKNQHEHTKVISQKAFTTSTLVQTFLKVVKQSIWSSCQLLCCSIDDLQWDRRVLCSWCLGKHGQGHTGKLCTTAEAAAWNPPSNILIVNISNSTLTECVIGNETTLPTVTEKQPLKQRNIWDLHSSKSRGPPRILIDNSNLSFVIFGDNNYMHVQPTEARDESEEDHEEGSCSVQEKNVV